MTLETASYTPADSYFGAPYIDRDEWREQPYPHRNIHGGFTGTDTRFTFYFPRKEEWGGRMFHPLEGAHAGHEDAFGGMMGQLLGGLDMMVRLGGYMIESNSGHIGDTMDPKAGEDPTIYGFRASIETARFSKFIAKQVYGVEPAHSYVWGGSGGGRRSPLCLEYCNGVYDGALPFMGGGDIDKHGTTARVRGEQPIGFAAMFNVQRLLGRKLAGVIDAMQPGGSGNPFEGLSSHQREELTNLYRLGYPRGDEFMIGAPMGQMWLWTATADMLQEEDADYFSSFWTKPGYVGFDSPEHVSGDLIDVVRPVKRVITVRELLESPDFAGPEFAVAKPMAMLQASAGAGDVPIAAQIEGVGSGYRQGAGLLMKSGKAAGRQLYCRDHVNDLFFVDGRGEANIQKFADVAAGDEIHINNRAFLAYCYCYRHHVSDDPIFDFLKIDGNPIYPQHRLPLQSPLMGVPYSGQYEGKLLWVHHTHDSSLWPPQGLVYGKAVEQAQGPEKAKEKYCLRWTDNAEHVGPAFLPSQPHRATNTWLIDYVPIIEQSLADLCEWVEKDVRPAGTDFDFAEGKVSLPPTASERGGIQPVVSVSVNGGICATAKPGESVTMHANAETPPSGGTIINIEWDLDGSGQFASAAPQSGKDKSVKHVLEHAYQKPGVYFATARVTAHREGQVDARSRRMQNVASARIIVA